MLPRPPEPTGPSKDKEPSRRHRLSVLFSDLSDSTALSGSLDPDDYAELLKALRATYETVVARHGGTVVRLVGDGLLAVFGHPLPREGDARRAVEAALELHEAVRALPAPAVPGRAAPLALHSGIHAGLVVVHGGDVVVGRFELMGMVPNIAYRLSAVAARGELLVSDETLGPARAWFITGAERHVQLHGHEGTVACWPVVGRATVASAFEMRPAASLQAFVGRHAELARLERQLADVLAGATRQVALAGPPGVGKTRLAYEFLRRAEMLGCRVLRGICDGEVGATPMQPVLQMLRASLGLPPDAPLTAALQTMTMALALLEPEGPEGTADVPPKADAKAGEASPADPVPGLARLFAAWAARQPLLLFVDDWHAADDATRHALAAICAAAQRSGLMLVVSTREIGAGDAGMRQVEVIEVAPFGPDDALASVRAQLPQVDPFVADEIVAYSGGNPLFIEELCHSAASGSPHPASRQAGRQAGSAWMQELIESRVARLAPEQAALLRTLAVIGNATPGPLLQAVLGNAPDAAALQALAAHDFVYPGAEASLRFKHGLTRDVVLDSMSLRERRPLHQRVAEALRTLAAAPGEEAHEALAYHLAAAGEAAQAAHHAEQAGDRAARLSALDRAKAMYHLALEQGEKAGLDGDTLSRWFGVTHKLGRISVFDASRKDLPVFERAVQRARELDDPALEARCEHWLGYLLYALGQARDAVRHCERAAALAGTGDDPFAVQARSTLGQAHAAASDYAAAAPLLEAAVAVKRQHRRGTGTPVGLAYSLVCLGSVAGDRGEFARAHALFDEAMGLLDGTPHEIGASIQGWRAVVLVWQGRWAEAQAAAAESTRIAKVTHSLFQFCQGRATGAWAAWMLNGDAAAIDRLDESTRWLEPRESGLFRSLDHGWLTEGHLARGDRVQARRHAVLAMRRARAGDVIGVAVACRALALCAQTRGQPRRAALWLAEAGRLATWRDSAHEAAANDLCAAQMAQIVEQRDDARRHAEAAAAAFERLEMRWHGERARALLAEA